MTDHAAGATVTVMEPRLYFTRIQWGAGATMDINRDGLAPTSVGTAP